MHITLSFQLVFHAVLFRQSAFHLFETNIMQLGGVNVSGGNFTVKKPRQFERFLTGAITMIGRINCYQNGFIARQ